MEKLKNNKLIYFDTSKHFGSTAYMTMIHAGQDEDEKWIPCLSYDERVIYEQYHHTKRKRSYLLGRYCAKQAIQSLIGMESLTSFSIISGIFQQPLVRGITSCGVAVSLSHSQHSAVAIAHYDHYPSGIDIEKIGPQHRDSILSIITKEERELISCFMLGEDEALALLWCAKESLSKALKTGLTLPFSFLEIFSIKKNGHLFEVHYKNFPQYSSINFIFSKMMYSITKPKNVLIHGLDYTFR